MRESTGRGYMNGVGVQLRPLLYLTYRSLSNGIRRAFTSGKRLITLLFVVVYYGFMVLRPFGFSGKSSGFSAQNFPIPTADSVGAIAFSAFGLMSVLLMLPLLSTRGGFRQADVDVLFATPVNPKAVMFLRMVREYIGTLLTPLFLVLFGGRTTFTAVSSYVSSLHASGPLVTRIASLAWFLMSFTWVCIGYGVGFFVNRSDLQADRNKRIIDILIFVLIVGSAVLVVPKLVQNPSMDGLIEVTQQLPLRIALFSATAANWMISGAVAGEWFPIISGIALFLAAAGIGLWIAISQVGFMYDQAAAKGFGHSEKMQLQRNSDLIGLSASRAREGKMKVGRVSRWIGRARLSGASALIWKDLLLQMRSTAVLVLLMGTMQLAMVIMPVVGMAQRSSPRAVHTLGGLMFFMQGISVLMLTMNTAISGFIELLKRVDFQKPLPFRPAGTVFWEVSAKCFPNIVVGAIASTVVLLFRPALWAYALGSELFVIGLSLVVSATIFTVTVAFSDAGDSSQRGFRGLLIILGIVIACFPGSALVGSLMVFLRVNPLLASIPATILNIGIAILISWFAGGLYDSFNPND